MNFLRVLINRKNISYWWSRRLRKQATENLKIVFDKEDRVLVAYLFGSYAIGSQTSRSDVDVAILLSEIPEKMLEYHLHLVDELSQISGNNVDLIILNRAPPVLRHRVVKHGKLIYCRNEKSRIEFEARTEDEYLDFSRAIARYDECLMRQILRLKEA